MSTEAALQVSLHGSAEIYWFCDRTLRKTKSYEVLLVSFFKWYLPSAKIDVVVSDATQRYKAGSINKVLVVPSNRR